MNAIHHPPPVLVGDRLLVAYYNYYISIPTLQRWDDLVEKGIGEVGTDPIPMCFGDDDTVFLFHDYHKIRAGAI